MDSTQIGLAGEFHVLAQLVQRGLVATLTLSNTKGVDILVSNAELDRLFKTEVKTTERGPGVERLFGEEPAFAWAMGEKHERIQDDKLFYCFVLLRGLEELPRFFVVPSCYVAAYVREQHAFWLRSRKHRVAATTMRRFRTKASDPLGFENNWSVLTGKPVPARQRRVVETWYRH